MRNVPVEITETLAPIVVWSKEYREDSGGAGEHRGGLGQVMEIGSAEGMPFGISPTFDRVVFPARGRLGDPHKRPAAKVAEDVALGLVSMKAARELYGVALTADGAVDEAETARLRMKLAAE